MVLIIKMSEIIEIYGVISSIYPIDTSNILRSQKIIIDNANTLNRSITIEPRILLIVNQPISTIDFKIGLPITAKGIFSKRKNSRVFSIIHTAHAPTGYIRYDGKVYS